MIDYGKLDRLLEELYKGYKMYPVPIGETYHHLFKPKDRASSEYRPYMAELEGLGLAIEKDSPGTDMTITPFGREVFKAGGWLAYKGQQKAKADRKDYKELLDIEKAQREIDKLKYEESIRVLEVDLKKANLLNSRLQSLNVIWGVARGAIWSGVGFVAAFLAECTLQILSKLALQLLKLFQ